MSKSIVFVSGPFVTSDGEQTRVYTVREYPRGLPDEADPTARRVVRDGPDYLCQEIEDGSWETMLMQRSFSDALGWLAGGEEV